MSLIIGVDEAGYGPNLGPLAVCATAWRVPAELDADNLTGLIPEISVQRPSNDQIQIADSKAVFKPGTGISILERTVQVMSRIAGFHLELANDWHSWLERFNPRWPEQRIDVPWLQGERNLPIEVENESIANLADAVRTSLVNHQVELIDVELNLIPARQFNELLRVNSSKGELLSNASAGLVRSILDRVVPDSNEPVLIHFDKHGGRNQYLPLLMQTFPEMFIQVICEGREISEYRWGAGAGLGEGNTRCRFVAKGDRFLPAALASNFAKYARELAMHSFNAYWTARIPELKPTAGYPMDAKRFRSEIESVQRDLEISDNVLWRER